MKSWCLRVATMAMAVTFAALLVGAPGCHTEAPPVPAQLDAPLAPAGDRMAVITVRASTDPAPTRRSVRLHGTAHFAQYAGIERAKVLALLGETDYADFTEFEQGQCSLRVKQRSRTFPLDESGAELELQEAGELLVKLPGSTFPLRPNPVPELVSFWSGVSYEGQVRRRSWPDRAGAPATARVEASGGFDVGPFEVEVEVAKPIRLVEIGGRAVVDGGVHHAVSPGTGARDLTVSWEPAGGPATLLVLEVSRSSFDSTLALRCLVEDGGNFTVPADELSKLAALSGATTDRLSVHRITVQSFQTRDIDDGVAIFVSEDSALLR